MRIVTIGGGHGASNLLIGLKTLNYKRSVQISAVVSAFDSGGSSGVIRKEYQTIALGDLRRALLTLSQLPKATLKVLDHRFQKGFLKNHSLGNLVALAAQQQKLDLNGIFQTIGQVMPVTWENACLCARLENGQVIEGETDIDIPKHNPNLKIEKIFLKKPAQANPQVLLAIKKADLVILGPGDLYSSVLPNLLVKGIAPAIRQAKAKKVFVCNLKNKKGETNNFTLIDYKNEVEKYLGGKLDRIIAPHSSLAQSNDLGIHNPRQLAKALFAPPVYVLDFDDTLINTHQLKIDHCLLPNYNNHPAILKKALATSHQYVFDDTLKLLKNYKSEKFVLSHCPSPYAKYQRLKIASSGLTNFFRKVFITSEADKVSAMAKIMERFPLAPIYFIDDTILPLEAVKRAFPQVIAVRIRRFPHQKPAISPYIDLEVKNLADLISVLKIGHLLP